MGDVIGSRESASIGASAGARPAPKLSPQPQISVGTILLLAATCGLIVANIYYAQPLIGPIAQTLGLAPQAAGLIVTMSQIGYGAGSCSSCRSAISSRTGG